jgi:ribonuclease E
LVVIDFIDMEDKRGNRIVERKLRDAMQNDRARIQLGRISAFGLLELSRQRLHPSLVETNFEVCKHCGGSGLIRTIETTAVMVLRAIEEEGMRGRASELKVNVPSEIALYIFNNKREMLANIERKCSLRIFIHADDELLKPNFSIDIVRGTHEKRDTRPQKLAPVQTVDISDLPEISEEEESRNHNIEESFSADDESPAPDNRNRGGRSHHRHEDHDGKGRRRGRRGGRRRGGRGRNHGNNRHAGGGNPPEGGASTDNNGGGGGRGSGDDAPSRQSHHHDAPSPAPVPQAANESGGNRKGWWKRLTE